ncbi:MAG: FxsA family protein [Pseudomonadota bacterium]
MSALRFSIVPFLLLVIPLFEIGAFILIGGQIGVLPTLGMVLITAIIGSILLRWQGFGLLAKIQTEMRGNKIPARELVHGVMILVAGVLLLTPGFVTDSLGFLLFVPPIRDAGWAFLRNKIKIVGPQNNRSYQPPYADGETIELDDEDFKREPDASSPWNRKD